MYAITELAEKFSSPMESGYPRPTSSAIIARNPARKPHNAYLSKPCCSDSGITSSMTTNIIAPAANASANARTEWAKKIIAAPIQAASGSTAADN